MGIRKKWVIFNVLNEFEGGYTWIKSFGPRGLEGLYAGNLKISSGKIGLVVHHCKILFKARILIKFFFSNCYN